MADAVEGRLGSECLGLIEHQVGVDRSAISKASPPPALLGQSHIDGSPSHTRQAPGQRHARRHGACQDERDSEKRFGFWAVDRSTDHLLPWWCLSRKRCLGRTAIVLSTTTNVGAAEQNEQAWTRRQVSGAAENCSASCVVLRPLPAVGGASLRERVVVRRRWSASLHLNSWTRRIRSLNRHPRFGPPIESSPLRALFVGCWARPVAGNLGGGPSDRSVSSQPPC